MNTDTSADTTSSPYVYNETGLWDSLWGWHGLINPSGPVPIPGGGSVPAGSGPAAIVGASGAAALGLGLPTPTSIFAALIGALLIAFGLAALLLGD